MIVRTEAIVLRSVSFGETSQVVTLYTQTLGTIAVMARGARGPRSKFGSTLQPMSHIQVVFYHKPSRQVHTLSEASHISLFKTISKELSRLSIGLRIVEAMAVLMPRPEANERAFVVLLNVLRLLDAAVSHWTNILPFFQLQISALLGFSPSLDRDQIEAIVEEGGFLRLSDGALFSFKPDQAALPISRRAARAIGILVHARIEHILRMDLDPSTASEVEDTVESYLRYHVEDFRPSRSKLVFEQIERS